MAKNNETTVIEAIQKLEEKVDNLASQIQNASAARLDAETVAVLTAAAYHIFGRAIAVRNVRIINSNAQGSKKNNRHYNVVASS